MVVNTLPAGIDVSNWQGTINWNSVRDSGKVFAFAKATESTDFEDPYFSPNWYNIKAAGFIRGAYHFARPSKNPDPTAECYHFMNCLNANGGLETGDLVALDFEDEDASGDLSGWVLFMCQIMESLIGYPPIIYTGQNIISSWRLNREPKLANYPLWLASYRNTFPPTPAPFPIISFWQYTNVGSVNGVNGNCDLNVFNGTPDKIALFGRPANAPSDNNKIIIKEIGDRITYLEERVKTLTTTISECTNELTLLRSAWQELGK